MAIGMTKEMNDEFKGIVTDVLDYKDNDAIITVMSDKYGKISLYVKGYKKITSKNVYATQLFDHSVFQIDFNETKNIQILKSATLLNEFTSIRADYEKITVGSVMSEIAGKLEQENVYEILLQSMNALNDLDQCNLVLDLYLVDILHRLGIYPNVDECVLCNNTNAIEAVSVEAGGFICRNCNRDIQAEKNSVDILKKFRIINKASFEVLDKLLPLEMNDYKITDILMMFLVTYSGIYLKSYKSLTNLNS